MKTYGSMTMQRWLSTPAGQNLLIPPDFVVSGMKVEQQVSRMIQLIPSYCVETNPAQQGGTENPPWATSISVYR